MSEKPVNSDHSESANPAVSSEDKPNSKSQEESNDTAKENNSQSKNEENPPKESKTSDDDSENGSGDNNAKSTTVIPETQNFEKASDHFTVPESQPNFDDGHGLTGLLKTQKKPHRSVEPIKLEDIPTWSDYAPEFLQGKKLPKPEELLFQPNDKINRLISYIPRGDSTVLAVDAIVNAANSGLYAGGGICGCIHSAAGPKLEEECMKIGGCKTGEAVITPGFDLPAKYVIHAVGPIGKNPEALKSAYQKTLEFLDGEKVRSVALCCISTGIYGYPIKPATKIALQTVREFLENPENQKKVDRIIFVVFNQKDCVVYENFLPFFFPLPEGAINGVEDEEEENYEEEEEEEGGMEFDLDENGRFFFHKYSSSEDSSPEDEMNKINTKESEKGKVEIIDDETNENEGNGSKEDKDGENAEDKENK